MLTWCQAVPLTPCWHRVPKLAVSPLCALVTEMLLCQKEKRSMRRGDRTVSMVKERETQQDRASPGTDLLQLRAWALPCSSVPSVLIKPFSESTDLKPYGTIQSPICKFPGHFLLFFPLDLIQKEHTLSQHFVLLTSFLFTLPLL